MLAISLDGLLQNFNQLALGILSRGALMDRSQQLFTGICERRCSDLWHSNHDRALQFPQSSCSYVYTIEWHHVKHCVWRTQLTMLGVGCSLCCLTKRSCQSQFLMAWKSVSSCLECFFKAEGFFLWTTNLRIPSWSVSLSLFIVVSLTKTT
jgi:hypothetical protein